MTRTSVHVIRVAKGRAALSRTAIVSQTAGAATAQRARTAPAQAQGLLGLQGCQAVRLSRLTGLGDQSLRGSNREGRVLVAIGAARAMLTVTETRPCGRHRLVICAIYRYRHMTLSVTVCMFVFVFPPAHENLSAPISVADISFCSRLCTQCLSKLLGGLGVLGGLDMSEPRSAWLWDTDEWESAWMSEDTLKRQVGKLS